MVRRATLHAGDCEWVAEMKIASRDIALGYLPGYVVISLLLSGLTWFILDGAGAPSAFALGLAVLAGGGLFAILVLRTLSVAFTYNGGMVVVRNIVRTYRLNDVEPVLITAAAQRSGRHQFAVLWFMASKKLYSINVLAMSVDDLRAIPELGAVEARRNVATGVLISPPISRKRLPTC